MRESQGLEIKGLRAGYDGTQVLHDLDLRVDAGEAVCLIGANGAGKSTLMRCIAGLLRPQAGQIRVHSQDLTGRPAADRFAAGVALVPEGRRVFAPMTVRENLDMGAFRRLWPRRDRRVAADMDGVFDLFPRLRERQEPPRHLLVVAPPVSAPARTPGAACRAAVGRRAADAGDRSRADVPPPPAAAG
jgi:branched-chain amino acid transport system ATP-binding protein